MSDFHLSAQFFSTRLPYHRFYLFCKQFSLRVQMLFFLVSGENLKDLIFFQKSFFFGSICACSKIVRFAATVRIFFVLQATSILVANANVVHCSLLVFMQLKKILCKIEMSDFHLSAQFFSTRLPDHRFCLFCKQFSLRVQSLFFLVSGENLKDFFFFSKIIFFSAQFVPAQR